MQQTSLFEQIADIVKPNDEFFTRLQAASKPYTPQTREDIFCLIYGNGGNNPATIVMHEDPGHGWLQVPHQVLKALGIQNKITGYSYRDTNYAYLEEDCDLSTFMRALNIEPGSPLQKIFWQVCPQEYKENTPIRNKKHY